MNRKQLSRGTEFPDEEIARRLVLHEEWQRKVNGLAFLHGEAAAAEWQKANPSPMLDPWGDPTP